MTAIVDPTLLHLPALHGLLDGYAGPVVLGEEGLTLLPCVLVGSDAGELRHGDWLVGSAEPWPEPALLEAAWMLRSARAEDLALDLAHRAARNRAADWLAGRIGLRGTGTTSAAWGRMYAPPRTFCLSVNAGEPEARVSDWFRSFPSPLEVAEDHDHRTLPDGSSWAHARALRLVCEAHLQEVS